MSSYMVAIEILKICDNSNRHEIFPFAEFALKFGIYSNFDVQFLFLVSSVFQLVT